MKITSENQSRSFFEPTLAFILLLLLLFGLYNTLSPFFGVFTFAIIFSVSFGQLFEKLAKLLNNKRKLAAFIYAVLLISLMALPFIYLISAITDYVQQAQGWFKYTKINGYPALPEKIAGLPGVGPKIQEFWEQLRADPAGTRALHEEQIEHILQQILSGGAGIVGSVFELLAGIIISAIFLTLGKKVVEPFYMTMERLVGETYASELINATGRAVKGVAVGVMGTAFIAALFAWIGFTIAGISFAVGLAGITFFLVLIQVGPTLVWLPVTIWFATNDQTGWAIFMGIYGLVVLTGIDNILKPVLIARTGKLPVLVLFLGVIGGMIAWGFTGMFKGAIILAIFYTIFITWVSIKKNKIKTA